MKKPTEKCVIVFENTVEESYDNGQIDILSQCIVKAESMLGHPVDDDLQKFIIWMKNEIQAKKDN